MCKINCKLLHKLFKILTWWHKKINYFHFLTSMEISSLLENWALVQNILNLRRVANQFSTLSWKEKGHKKIHTQIILTCGTVPAMASMFHSHWCYLVKLNWPWKVLKAGIRCFPRLSEGPSLGFFQFCLWEQEQKDGVIKEWFRKIRNSGRK